MMPDIERIKLHTSHGHHIATLSNPCPYNKGENFWAHYNGQRKSSSRPHNHYSLKLSMNCSDGIPNTEYNKLHSIIKNYQQPIKLHVLEKAIKDFSYLCINNANKTTNQISNSMYCSPPQKSNPSPNKSRDLKILNSSAMRDSPASKINETSVRKPMTALTSNAKKTRGISFYINQPSSFIPPLLHPMIEKALIDNVQDMKSILSNCKTNQEDDQSEEAEIETSQSKQEKDVFHFKLDAFNDSYHFRRERSVQSNSISKHNSTKIRQSSIHIAPSLQRKMLIPDPKRDSSLHAYYHYTEDPNNETSDLMNKALRNDVWSDAKAVIKIDRIKSIEEIKKSIINKKIKYQYHMNECSVDHLAQQDFLVLYRLFKSALQPNFYGFSHSEINALDSDQAELQLHYYKDNINEKYSPYDSELITLYDSIMNSAVACKIPITFWTPKYNEFYPTSRHSALFLCENDKMYLFGGYSAIQCNDLWQLYNQPNESFEWKCISKGDEKLLGRYGCSGCLTKEEIYIFGGYGDYFKSVKTRRVFNDLWKFSIKHSKWTLCSDTPNKPSQRAYAAHCLMDQCIFIHGGSNGISRGINRDSALYDIGMHIMR